MGKSVPDERYEGIIVQALSAESKRVGIPSKRSSTEATPQGRLGGRPTICFISLR